MKIAITGSSGYLGRLISNELLNSGHSIIPISRELLYQNIEQLRNTISETDVVIHLSGSPILVRWTEKNRKNILNSRIVTTQNLSDAINHLPPEKRPKKFIQASAIGIYKAFSNHDESSLNYDTGFVGSVVQQWENASADLPNEVQRIVFRIGLVLGKNAKTISNLRIPFHLGLGAKIGKGNQPFPFVHDADVASAFKWAVENENMAGTFNLVAPQQISNRDFTNALAKTMKRPAFFTIPEIIMKIALGDAAVLLTDIPNVVPKKLLNSGFYFQYPRIESALEEIFSK